jgi:hypothetical protein
LSVQEALAASEGREERAVDHPSSDNADATRTAALLDPPTGSAIMLSTTG